MPSKKPNTSKENLELVNYKVDELQISQQRTENKVDKLTDMVGKLSYVSTKQHTEDMEKTVKKEDLEVLVLAIIKKWSKPYRVFLISLGTALLITLATAILNWILRGGLTR